MLTPVQRKLDRVMVNSSWLNSFDLSLASFLPRGLSDHCPATVHFGVRFHHFLKPFQVFKHLMEHSSFLDVVSTAWNLECTGNPWFILTSKLKNVKVELKKLNCEVGNLHSRVISAREELYCLQSTMGSMPTPVQREEEGILCANLSTALRVEEDFLKQKSRITWLKKGDGNNGYFFNACKGR